MQHTLDDLLMMPRADRADTPLVRPRSDAFKWCDAQESAIFALLHDGWRPKVLSDALGINKQTLYRWACEDWDHPVPSHRQEKERQWSQAHADYTKERRHWTYRHPGQPLPERTVPGDREPAPPRKKRVSRPRDATIPHVWRRVRG